MGKFKLVAKDELYIFKEIQIQAISLSTTQELCLLFDLRSKH